MSDARKFFTIMRNTFKILFYVRKNQVNKEGKAGVMVRITVNGETSQFSSKLDIEPAMWDTDRQRMIGNTVKARQFNSLLDDIRASIRKHYCYPFCSATIGRVSRGIGRASGRRTRITRPLPCGSRTGSSDPVCAVAVSG